MTREAWHLPLPNQELISGHFGEDSASYEAEIRELEDLRQVGGFCPPPASLPLPRPIPPPVASLPGHVEGKGVQSGTEKRSIGIRRAGVPAWGCSGDGGRHAGGWYMRGMVCSHRLLLGLWEPLLCARPFPGSLPGPLLGFSQSPARNRAHNSPREGLSPIPRAWSAPVGRGRPRGLPGRGVLAVAWPGCRGPAGTYLQAARTPSQSEAGLGPLTAYYKQLCFLDARFVTPPGNLGLHFHW